MSQEVLDNDQRGPVQPTIDVGAFHKVADAILEHDRFDLSSWCYVRRSGEMAWDDAKVVWDLLAQDPTTLVDHCGTTGCIAGWTNAVITHKPLSDSNAAATALGITEAQSYRLFYGEPASIWARQAERFGWRLGRDGALYNNSDVTAVQAAQVMREIADGKLVL